MPFIQKLIRATKQYIHLNNKYSYNTLIHHLELYLNLQIYYVSNFKGLSCVKWNSKANVPMIFINSNLSIGAIRFLILYSLGKLFLDWHWLPSEHSIDYLDIVKRQFNILNVTDNLYNFNSASTFASKF